MTEVKHLALLVAASGAQTNWMSSVLLRNPLRDPDPGHQPATYRVRHFPL